MGESLDTTLRLMKYMRLGIRIPKLAKKIFEKMIPIAEGLSKKYDGLKEKAVLLSAQSEDLIKTATEIKTKLDKLNNDQGKHFQPHHCSVEEDHEEGTISQMPYLKTTSTNEGDLENAAIGLQLVV